MQKRARAAYYLVPMFIFTSLAVSNFLHVSFGVYLKYQALIDSTYQHKLDQKYDKLLDSSSQANIDASAVSRSETILSMPNLPPMGAPSRGS